MRIIVSGLQDVSQKLERMSGEQLQAEVEKTTLSAVLFVQGEIPGYPAPPSGSRYRRTGTLGRTVTALAGRAPEALSRVETVGGRVTGFVGTSLSYAKWVIDIARQAWMHRGRWWTLQGVARGARGGIIKLYQAMVQRLVRG